MSEIKLLDLARTHARYRAQIDAAIARVIDHGRFIIGPEVAELEAALSSFSGAPHTVCCANGTDALMLALMAIDIRPGDEVITSAFSFAAAAEVIALLGAIPVFVDVDPESFNIAPREVEAALTTKTRAIIPVGLFGQPAEMDSINQIAEQANAVVIEDAAQSFGASYRGRRSGALSALATTSFFPAKPLGCLGDGGAVFCSDRDVAQRIARLRLHGQSERFVHSEVGVNSRLDTLQAAVLLVKLPHYAHEIEARQRAAQRYDAMLSKLALATPKVANDRSSIWAQYCVRLQDRDRVQTVLQERGVQSAVYYPLPLHRQPAWQHVAVQAACPNADRLAAQLLALPFGADITAAEQQRVADALSAALTPR
ncbi:MAG: DegT/DnrJ/EryC1/StrS family aminotransferase [Deltaproteobacteria bacterium]|nr:DegT/DnrJ/EryC1/StrS family aminotransferase [Deltaproteobacteria bacterium]